MHHTTALPVSVHAPPAVVFTALELMAVRAIALVSTCLLLWQVSAAQGSTSRSAKGANTTSTRDPAAPSPVHYEVRQEDTVIALSSKE